MILDYVGVKEINGSLIVLDDVENASFEEIVEIRLDDGTSRQGRIVQICLLYTSLLFIPVWKNYTPIMRSAAMRPDITTVLFLQAGSLPTVNRILQTGSIK